jgi:hypothetical protein
VPATPAEFDKEGPVPRLTILIPCVGGAAEFDATLVSVLQHRPDDCEVLLVHTEPYDDPYDLTGEVNFFRVDDSTNLVQLINEGVNAADGQIVHLLGCGLEVTEGWTDAAVERFDEADVAAVSPLVLDSDRETLVAAGVRWTAGGARRVVADSRILHGGSARLRAGIEGPTLAAGFYRREVMQALGGFDANLDERYADVDLALAIAALDLRSICEPASRVVQTSAAGDDLRRWPFSRGRSAERLFWRHAEARGKLPSLVMHPFSWVGDLLATRSPFGTLLAHAGRCFSLLEVGAVQQHERRIAEAREQLTARSERATIRLAAPAAGEAPVAGSQRRRAA